MHYTFHQLNIFLKVADCQSITKAAQELHLTQPAVSIQLKKLQDQFDLPLTEVIGRQLYVTDFGNAIAIKCRSILEEANAIKYTVDQYKGLLSGTIKIAVVSTAKYIIPYFLKPFMDLYPNVEISIDVSNKTKVIEGLNKNESDFTLVSVLPEGLKINKVELMENRLYLLGHKNFEGKLKKPKDLEKHTLIFREEGSATRNAMLRYLESRNIQINKSMKLVSNEAIKQTIYAGIGCSVVPLIGLKNALNREDVKIFPLKGLPIITTWNMIYMDGKQLTPAQNALIDFIEENKARIVEKHFDWALNPIE